MITNKKELKDYLEADRVALGYTTKRPSLFGQDVWKFQIALRYYEYSYNTHRRGIVYKFRKFIYLHYSKKLGFTIPPNVFGKGLNIHHYGCIVINSGARIGENCNIQQCVNIGHNRGFENVPTIGNNVYIGPGVKIFGKIEIADGIAIGAGSVVTKSFLNPNVTIV